MYLSLIHILYLISLLSAQLRLAFLKKFGCRQVAIDIEREVSWTRRPSMQISSALHWARRSSLIDSLMDSSRKYSRRDSNTSAHSDSNNPVSEVTVIIYIKFYYILLDIL